MLNSRTYVDLGPFPGQLRGQNRRWPCMRLHGLCVSCNLVRPPHGGSQGARGGGSTGDGGGAGSAAGWKRGGKGKGKGKSSDRNKATGVELITFNLVAAAFSRAGEPRWGCTSCESSRPP